MIVDSSAWLAIILNEDDEPRFAAAMIDARALRMSAANWAEAAIVVDSHKPQAATDRFEDLAAALRREIVPVTVEHAHRTRPALQDFGQGPHRAGLNYSDCFAYALAKLIGQPLLYKGNGFSHTDIEPALKD